MLCKTAEPSDSFLLPRSSFLVPRSSFLVSSSFVSLCRHLVTALSRRPSPYEIPSNTAIIRSSSSSLVKPMLIFPLPVGEQVICTFVWNRSDIR